MIDPEGYRFNVGIILCNGDGRVFWARRAGMDSWQFPQGGIKQHEAPEKAMYRELTEETGLASKHVEVLGCTKSWLRYHLPKRFIRKNTQPICIGQNKYGIYCGYWRARKRCVSITPNVLNSMRGVGWIFGAH